MKVIQNFQENRERWMKFKIKTFMATLFSPTKRIIQEGDLAIIWIV